ncbi:TetR/AcrR family transcriptional regulator, partial [Vibrio parahaemolyticus]|nr:TetR/AcrR family transcriptional regulator [Vibrio parahaemolyticus]MDF4360717.1 TetR/AcrR family transcriptional regulator [Vibrio parahaemolyticus]
ICYSLFVQANRFKGEAELKELVSAYLDMLCIYNREH